MISIGVFLEDNEDRRKILWMLEDYEKIDEKRFLSWKNEPFSVLDDAVVWKDVILTYDIIVVMVGGKKDIEFVKELRVMDEKVEIVVILSENIPPEQLILPSIRPILCLKSPLIMENMREHFLALFQYIIRRKEGNGLLRRFSCQRDSVRRIIPYSEICYFETCNKQIMVKTRRGEFYFYDSLSRIEPELPSYFVRCHRGYIVNIFCVTEICGVNQLYIGKETIPIAKKYQKKLKGVFC